MIPLVVYRGMCWLDKQLPDWYKRINLEILDIGDVRYCILGQLYGRFKPRRQMYDLGFYSVGHDYESVSMNSWYLTTEWKRQITLRNSQ
jgi:hypothetical protein